jgi:beta-lactamase superfamily II metal-dependent hydrolase
MSKCSWEEDTMYVFIFNVGRGLFVLVRTPGKFGILYDIGSSEDFSPVEDFLEEHDVFEHLGKYKSSTGDEYYIPQIIVSHPHNDHIGEIVKLKRNVTGDDDIGDKLHPHLLTCPHDIPPKEGQRDERFDFGRMGDATDTEELKHYRSLFKGRTPPLLSLEPTVECEGFEYGIFYVRPPEVEKIHDADQDYINGSSVCLYLKYGDNSILIPGDITPAVLERIIDGGAGVQRRYTVFSDEDYNKDWSRMNSDQPSLKNLLKEHGLTVLVAPHHGLESSFPERLYKVVKGGKPDFVVISERRKSKDAPGTVDQRYQSEDGSKGVTIDVDGDNDEGDDGEGRHSLGTRSGYHIAIAFPRDGDARYYARSDADDLLNIF